MRPELSHIVAWNEVIFKKNKFIISDFNFYTFIDILKILDNDSYNKFMDLDKHKLKFAINSIISENKDLSPEQIIKYIVSLNLEFLDSLGDTYIEIISNFLSTNNFQKKDNKGLIFLDTELIDFEFLFRNFPDLNVLFIFNEETGTLTLIDRNLHVLQKFNNKKEADISDIFEDYDEKKQKEDKNRYYNDLMTKLLLDYFSTDTFMNNFLDEIFFKLSNLIIMADEFEIDERNLELLQEHYEELCKNKKVESVLIRILGKKNFNKYSEIENIL